MMPTTGSAGSTGRRFLAALVGLVLLALIIRDPVGAAGFAEQLGAWSATALDALVRFGSALGS